MKKLLSIAFCAATAMAFATGTEITVADVGVTVVTLPANQTNTIIAASFKELGSSENICISNLVKTTGLAAGDKLMLYTSKNTYDVWQLDENKVWKQATRKYTVGKDGVAIEGTGTPTATTVAAGTGLWIVREDPSSTASVTLYGAYIDESKTKTTTAGVWNFIGNPSQSAFDNFPVGDKGDQIVVPNPDDGASLRSYVSDGTKWTYTTTEDKTYGGKTYKLVKTVEGKPTIAPGAGFWYNAKVSQTLSFGK